MNTTRLEAFSDGVIAIIITIMVLELHAPEGATLAALQPLIPKFLAYILSFTTIGIYWNNHHHLLHSTKSVNSRLMWMNLFLLFWMSLIPLFTAWMGEHPLETWPAAFYGLVNIATATAFFLLIRVSIAINGKDSELARSVGRNVRGRISIFLYVLAIIFAFINPVLSYVLFVFVALQWFIPDRHLAR